ncbi:AAA family ATPase [Streptococcus thermophilus]|uniref:AAA family ATPase n=1 Tax=Streptococcus thermophilus TaxID=1308 RepID=UPI000A07D306|nr:AAA family ATPase [Streptococcus thermophilus]
MMITELQLPSDRFFNTTYSGLKQKNFIYGKNGTGKSTITQTISDLFHATHDVRIFQGFDSVAENSALNAISLGRENASIQPQIDQVSLQISELEKDLIANDSRPDNLYARYQSKEKEYKEQEKSINNNFSSSASKLKREHTDLTGVYYDIRNFKRDIECIENSVSSVLLSDTETEQLQQLMKQEEIKIETKQSFPNVDVSGFLEATNEIITTELAKSIILEFSTIEEQNWVREGLNYHEEGDVCAFCNNPISEQRLDQLNHYFSDNVKKFETRLSGAIEHLKSKKYEISKINVIEPSQFYPIYREQISVLNTSILKLIQKYTQFLDFLIKTLEKRKSNLFTTMSEISYKIPDSFESIKEQYGKIYVENKKYGQDLTIKKEEAKNKLRLNLVNIELSGMNYSQEISDLKDLGIEKKRLADELKNNQNNLLALRTQKYDLISQTIDESIAAERINKALRSLGNHSFQLVLVSGEQKGQYTIKNIDGSTRDVDTLSTGEKNIVSFLWFLADLDNPSKKTENPQIIIFDDPMNSNDDTTQYLIISYLQDLINNLSENQQLFILTHNIHFYLNVRYDWWRKASKTKLTLHLKKIDGKSKILPIETKDKDLKTSYDALWTELKWLYQQDKPDFMLNPIRRIFETFSKFNNISLSVLFKNDAEAKKLFDVNSHSIDDLEADLNGKTKEDIIAKVRELFSNNNAQAHFEKNWD